MDNLEKTELTTSICHIAIILKSEILIPESQIPLIEKQELCISRNAKSI